MTNEEAIKLLINATYSDEWQGNEDLTTAHHMAIKALSAEPCEDCISRQAVIDLAITIETDDYSGNEVLEVVEVEEIKKLPSVTPQQLSVTDFADKCKECGKILNDKLQTRWIPVSEKPQKGRYLCTYEHCDGKCIDFGWFDGESWYIKPIAYMPLPEPYKVESKIKQAGAYADQDTLMSAT